MTSRNERLHRTLYVVSIITILVTLGVMFFAMYLYFVQDNPPISLNHQPFLTRVNNDEVFIMMDYCKYSDGIAQIDISFIDGVIYNTPSINMAGLNRGECRVFELPVEIPESLPSGTYHIHGKSTYQVNALATRTVSWETEKFVINNTKTENR